MDGTLDRKGAKGLKKGLARALVLAVLLLWSFCLCCPLSAAGLGKGQGTDTAPFEWNRDTFWEGLETTFQDLRRTGCAGPGANLDVRFQQARSLVARMGGVVFSPEAPELSALEESIFGIAPVVAACGRGLEEFIALSGDLRRAVKKQSEGWDATSRSVRVRLYRLLYGLRAALEEVLLQANPVPKLPPTFVTEEPSSTPSAVMAGVRIHSGDILVSRGGAPTSALIARGSDFPGNFSHVALAYVAADGNKIEIVESLIERGVVVSSGEEYLRDKKLRIMVLRPRSTLPAVAADPLLPHKAAKRMVEAARARHIPYDFSMDIGDHAQMFCSEVASAAYEPFGINLWGGLSRISSPGLRRWLWGLGVRHFETQEPSDLEYDPQASVVVEWYDPETLRKDHLDNAVTDAMIEGAEKGDELSYGWYLLPVAGVMKLYSSGLNLFGAAGPIPEGISPAGALRTDAYRKRHRAIAGLTATKGEAFQREHGYHPPYWQLVRLARMAKQELEGRRP